MTALRFPADIAVGEVWWEDAQEPGRWRHLLATGTVEVPDGTAVRLQVGDVAEVSVSDRDHGHGWAFPVGAGSMPAVRRVRRSRYRRSRRRVTWQRGMGDGALRNDRSIWGEPGKQAYSVEYGDEPVDLEFIRELPARSVFELSLGDVAPASFAAVAHLAPGLRDLSGYIDDWPAEAPSVIAQLSALERLSLAGNEVPEDGATSLLDDHVLSELSDLAQLEYLALVGGSYSDDGLQQLSRLPNLQHLHIEREGLTAPMLRFAAAMPTLTRLTGLDEFGEDGPMPPAEVDRVRAMFPPHVSME